ncbi:MAG: hypothetical protein J5I65_13780 [Aridibacter famidurans]|nr:hypothetical protein [Aridibacter famidurans]
MKITVIVLLLFVSGVSSFPQETEISRDAFWDAKREALAQTRAFDRRVMDRTERYENGEFRNTELWLYEYLLPERKRVVSEMSFGGRTMRTELVVIGETKYCKRNDQDWAISTGSCIGGSVSGGKGPVTERYIRQEESIEGEKLKRYHSRTTQNGWDKKDERIWFSESTFWVDKSGRLVKEEARRGIVDPFSFVSQSSTRYEYEPKDLAIEAPIKP